MQLNTVIWLTRAQFQTNLSEKLGAFSTLYVHTTGGLADQQTQHSKTCKTNAGSISVHSDNQEGLDCAFLANMSLLQRNGQAVGQRHGQSRGKSPRLSSMRCRATNSESSPISWNDDAFGLLMSRVQQLRAREERARSSARLLETLRASRPILPENVTRQELELDHKLICESVPYAGRTDGTAAAAV
jgi:hypothetical protein